MEIRKNKNQGYQRLRVWSDAIEYYRETCKVFTLLPYELKRVTSQQIACSDSVHRNIAEGYCRRSIKEYLNFLNIAVSSLGEPVSGLFAVQNAKQFTEEQFQCLDALAFKLENGLLKLIKSLKLKKETGTWIDQLVVKDTNAIYNAQ